MSAAAPAISPVALRGADELPAPVSGQRHEIGSPVGRLTYYSAGPEIPGKFPPLLLIHSINAAGSAYEIKPLYEHYRRSRTVYALELPGFRTFAAGRARIFGADDDRCGLARSQGNPGSSRPRSDRRIGRVAVVGVSRPGGNRDTAGFSQRGACQPHRFQKPRQKYQMAERHQGDALAACVLRVSGVERRLFPAAHQPRRNSLLPEQDLGFARYRRGLAGIRLSDHAPAGRPARAVLFRVRISVQRGHHPDLSFADIAGVDEPRRPRRFCRLHQQDAGRRPRQLDHPGVSDRRDAALRSQEPSSLRPTMLSLPACRRRRRHKALPCPASSGARMAQTGPTGISAPSSKLPEFVGMCKEWARGRRCF